MLTSIVQDIRDEDVKTAGEPICPGAEISYIDFGTVLAVAVWETRVARLVIRLNIEKRLDQFNICCKRQCARYRLMQFRLRSNTSLISTRRDPPLRFQPQSLLPSSPLFALSLRSARKT